MSGFCEDCRHWQYKAFPLPGGAEGVCTLHGSQESPQASAAAFAWPEWRGAIHRGLYDRTQFATARDFGCVKFEAKA